MHTNESTPPILIAFELSNKTWQTASTDGKRTRYKSLPAHDMEALMAEIKHLPGHFRVESPSFISCYEAGRDGFSVHRMLDKLNVANLVVDSASIEVPRGHKQVKTDMVDAKKLLKLLQRHVGGEPNVFKVARVPEPEAEDARRLPREIERLKKERSAHVARIKSC